MPRAIRTAPSAATPSTAQRRAARMPTARLPGPQPGAATPYRFTVAAIDGGNHRSPGQRCSTRPRRLPCRRPDLPTRTCSRHTGASSRTCSATTGRSPSSRRPTTTSARSPIAGQDDPLVTGWARLRGISVEPRVEHAGSGDPAHAAHEPRQSSQISSGASRPGGRERLRRREHRLRGRRRRRSAALTALREELAQTLHAQGATVAMAVKTGATTTGRSGFFDYPALAAIYAVRDGLGSALVDEPGRRRSPTPPGCRRSSPTSRPCRTASASSSARSCYGFDWPLGGVRRPSSGTT